MYNLIFAHTFEKNLNETFEYIPKTLVSPNAAKNLMSEIDKRITDLKQFPEMCPYCNEPLSLMGYRKLIIKNYVIVYYVDKTKETVNLLRCFYGRENYLKYFE